MTTQRIEAAETRPLEILGISEWEERVYRCLLMTGSANTVEIAETLSLPPGKTQRLLDAIEAKGLATHSPERPRRYVPTAPDVAIPMLTLQYQQAVQRAERMIPELQQMVSGRQRGPAPGIELITSQGAGKRTLDQILHSAQHEIAFFVRLPVLYTPLDAPDAYKDIRDEVQVKKVRCRTINDAEYLASPGALERIRTDIAAGEEARVFPSLPFKLLLADHRFAFLPLIPNQFDSPVLLVRHSALLDALYMLFEILWERAVPLSFTRAGTPRTSSSRLRLSTEAKDLAWLLASGLNDKTIAHDLRISLRTLERRVAELVQSLDTRTRFQAGWAAALHLSGVGALSSMPHSRRKQ